MRKTITLLTVILLSVLHSYGEGTRLKENMPAGNPENTGKLALVTYVADNIQVRHARILIESLRHNGGLYSGSEVCVVVCDSLVDLSPIEALGGVITIRLHADRSVMEYPYAVKAFAAAAAEESMHDRAAYLAWFDPETLILSEPDRLVPDGGEVAAAQPVFQSNTIGIPAGNGADDFWDPICRLAGISPAEMPVVETLIDNKRILGYYNCEIVSVKASEGIFTSWGDAMQQLLSDSLYSRGTCNTPQRMTFLHQAALSAIIIQKTGKNGPAPLPLKYGYPLHAQKRIPEARSISSLDNISCAILEGMWVNDPSWMGSISASDTLREELSGFYLEFMEVLPGLYRQEGSCNSYLVITGDSSVLIDPAGASSYPDWFRKITALHPLSLILLTHGHNDHRDNTWIWSDSGRIPVIAQREITGMMDYQDMLEGFFRHRNAIWSGQYKESGAVSAPSRPTITQFFDDSLILRKENITIRLWHTSGETPDHTLIFIPEMKMVFVGDNYYSSFPNIYTLRGTRPRWALDYIRCLDIALRLKPDLLFPGHGEWLQGMKQVDFYAGGYRDAIKYVHDETVKGMNEGKDRYTLLREIRLPAEYSFINQAYGTVQWSVRGIYEGYAGWFDENPASMYDTPFSSVSDDIVNLTGITPLLTLAREYLGSGDYVKGLHLTDMVLIARPGTTEALELRREILKALKGRCTNYIENIWLNYGIFRCSDSKLP